MKLRTQEQKRDSRWMNAFEQRMSAVTLSIKEGTGNETRIERSRHTKISNTNSTTIMAMPSLSFSSYSF